MKEMKVKKKIAMTLGRVGEGKRRKQRIRNQVKEKQIIRKQER